MRRICLLQYGRESIEKNLRRRNSESEDELDGGSSDGGTIDRQREPVETDEQKATTENNGLLARTNKNGYVNSQSNVITREDFILLPEPGLNSNAKNGGHVEKVRTMFDNSVTYLPLVHSHVRTYVRTFAWVRFALRSENYHFPGGRN